MAKPITPCFFFPSLLKRLVDFLATDQGSKPSLLHRRKGKRRGREIGKSATESWKALLLPHSTGYQGINGVLKALRGGRNGGFLERFRMMERQRRRENRVSGGAEKDGCIFSLHRSSAVTQYLALPLTRGQTISGLAVNIKGAGFLCYPWSQGDTDPCNTHSAVSH